MIPALRRAFNAGWTEERYGALLETVAAHAGGPLQFPIAETPCFFERAFIDRLAETGRRLVEQLDENPAAMAAANAAVPVRFSGPNEDPVPRFLQVDFGLIRTADGVVEPRLVELQAFPSLYGLQRTLAEAYRVLKPGGALLVSFLDPEIAAHRRMIRPPFVEAIATRLFWAPNVATTREEMLGYARDAGLLVEKIESPSAIGQSLAVLRKGQPPRPTTAEATR